MLDLCCIGLHLSRALPSLGRGMLACPTLSCSACASWLQRLWGVRCLCVGCSCLKP